MNLGILKVNNSTDRKNAYRQNTRTHSFTKLFLFGLAVSVSRPLKAREQRFRLKFLNFFLFSFFFFQAVDYLLSVKPNARTSPLKSYYPVDQRGSIYIFVSLFESPFLRERSFTRNADFGTIFFSFGRKFKFPF